MVFKTYFGSGKFNSSSAKFSLIIYLTWLLKCFQFSSFSNPLVKKVSTKLVV